MPYGSVRLRHLRVTDPDPQIKNKKPSSSSKKVNFLIEIPPVMWQTAAQQNDSLAWQAYPNGTHEVAVGPMRRKCCQWNEAPQCRRIPSRPPLRQTSRQLKRRRKKKTKLGILCATFHLYGKGESTIRQLLPVLPSQGAVLLRRHKSSTQPHLISGFQISCQILLVRTIDHPGW